MLGAHEKRPWFIYQGLSHWKGSIDDRVRQILEMREAGGLGLERIPFGDLLRVNMDLATNINAIQFA